LKFFSFIVIASLLSGYAEDAGRSVEVYDYKPHYACSEAGRDNAIGWIEQVLRGAEAGGSPDFFAISQLEKQTIDLPDNFRALGAFCDHAGSEGYADVIGILYNADTWTLNASFPTNQTGGACPLTDDSLPSDTCTWGQSTPCCACTGNPDAAALLGGKPIGDRAFVIGRFEDQAANELCVGTANLPHPVDAQNRRGCDLATPIDCLQNSNDSGPFGTENFVDQLARLCGDVRRVIFLGDTNASNPNWSLEQMFPVGPMSQMKEANSDHYTCCFDRDASARPDSSPINQYPADRIGARGARSVVTTGGATSPGIAILPPTVYSQDTCPASSPQGSYGLPCCGSKEEHAPLRSVVKFGS
jgi:hypothetical protein